ncbi:hypothetical protein [Micromonospora sp. CPCC 206061]|uniref:hypothetical protein n=1 Tax=Micromonospora sp. CPCC 206061 TaxID=3122410 RepID=UPI002FF0F3FB
MAQSRAIRAILEAIAVAVAPVVLLVSLLLHPYIGMGFPRAEAVAAAVVAHPNRWGFAHLAAAMASGLVLLALLAVRRYLREAGEERFSAFGIPFVAFGSTLYAMLPAMEMSPLMAAKTGGNVEAVQTQLIRWFLPVLIVGAISFAIGVAGFARGIAASRVLSRQLTWLVVAALAVMAVARFVPLSVVQFYVHGIAGIVALWPLAYQMWTRPAQTMPASRPG